METLNTIEKITLLVSTSIVCLANLFVLIEKTKKSEKHTLNTIIQKLLGFKNTFFVFCLIVVMSSCSGGKFLNRKYTSGRFIENKKSLTHNTTYVDTTKIYSSLNTNIEFKKSSVSLNRITDKEIINKKVESIIKKDSIFIFRRVGRDNIVIVKNNLPNVTIHIDENGKKLYPKTLTPIEVENVQKRVIKKIKVCAILGLCLSLIPGIGFGFAITAKRNIKRIKNTNSFKGINNYNVISNIALGISVIPFLLVLYALIIAVIIVKFLFGM